LHRLGLEYHKPDDIPRKRTEATQRAFIASGGLCAHAFGGLRDWRVFQTLQDRLVKELARKASPSIGPSR
jgi:hypothetical protein